jgi:NAD(P)H-dependent flavin oxidoreductase YrpB (nitropropane dioxygenase family)
VQGDHPVLPAGVFESLQLPVIGAPLFIISGPDLVIAQCKAGIVGSFPALNARPQPLLDEWLHRVTEELAAWDKVHPERPAAPFAVNQIVHKSNSRLDEDLATCAKWKVPVVITSLGERKDVNIEVKRWGSITLHDVISNRFAHKAVEKEANAVSAYKRMIVEASADDIVYSDLFTGVHGNYLRPSIVAAGLDPANLPKGDYKTMNFAEQTMGAKAWRDVWGCGQGIGVLNETPAAADLIARLLKEYLIARNRLCLNAA